MGASKEHPARVHSPLDDAMLPKVVKLGREVTNEQRRIRPFSSQSGGPMALWPIFCPAAAGPASHVPPQFHQFWEHAVAE